MGNTNKKTVVAQKPRAIIFDKSRYMDDADDASVVSGKLSFSFYNGLSDENPWGKNEKFKHHRMFLNSIVHLAKIQTGKEITALGMSNKLAQDVVFNIICHHAEKSNNGHLPGFELKAQKAKTN